jgi:hypothetical protein
MPTPAQARQLVAAALTPLIRVVYDRRIDPGSDLTAQVRWTDWLEPRTGCPGGLVQVEVTLSSPGLVDVDAQSAVLDDLVVDAAAVLDAGAMTRRDIVTDVDDELGYIIRITVEVT